LGTVLEFLNKTIIYRLKGFNNYNLSNMSNMTELPQFFLGKSLALTMFMFQKKFRQWGRVMGFGMGVKLMTFEFEVKV
jgi:hypothetical protein